ncbi:hypothetical protein HDU82_000006 [Entophlyctis luteolus]|nr:hypothetical protein HDU82_000006 [Entophlyctis luteolus]
MDETYESCESTTVEDIICGRELGEVVDLSKIEAENFETPNPHYEKSSIWHDIARYVIGDEILLEKCCHIFGTASLNSLFDGLTPLAVAIMSGNNPFIQYFTTTAQSSNIDFNVLFDPYSNTYLHLAAYNGDPEAIGWVLQRFRLNGLEKMVDASNDHEQTAYEICVSSGHEKASMLFRTSAIGKTNVYNVLLVGVSQSAKSTFVKYLHEYNGQIAKGVKMGDGVHSCTSVCNSYRLQLKNKEFFAIPRSQTKDGRESKVRVFPRTSTSDQFQLRGSATSTALVLHSKSSNFRGFGSTAARVTGAISTVLSDGVSLESKGNVISLYEKNLDIHEVEFINKPPISINLIDTPGIGDDKDQGDGVDEQNIIQILEYLQTNKISQLHAILFIVKPALLSSPLKEKICYYFRMFNRDIGSIYVIFSHYSKKERKRDLKLNVNITEERLKFLRECGLTSDPYVFNLDLTPPSTIDEDIEDRDLVMEFMNNVEISTIFRTIVSFDRCLDVGSIKFLKTQNMKYAEARILHYIEGRRTGAISGVKQFDESAAHYLTQIEAKQQELRKVEVKKKNLENSIREQDSDKIVLVFEKQYIDGWYWFTSRPEKHDKCTSEFPITDVDTVTKSSVVVAITKRSEKSCAWSVRSKWWTKQDALVRIFTQSWYRYKTNIATAKEKLTTAGIELGNCQKELQKMTDEANENSKEIAELTVLLEKFTKATLFLNESETTIEQYHCLKNIYRCSEIGEGTIDTICEAADMNYAEDRI